jgi:ribosomal peptide maturation radical SAM protein 1
VKHTRLALIAMPFVSARSPSLQLGLLGAEARRHGFPTRTFHFNLDFAALIGEPSYELLCDFGRQPIGDWLFSPAAFGDDAPDPAGRLLDDYPESAESLLRHLGWTREHLLRVRAEYVPQYLDWLARLVDWPFFDVVGFTSTFQQNVASLALSRRVKAAAPSALIIFGGANVEDEMGLELLRIAPWVDLTVVGEADETLPELLEAVAKGANLPGLRGVATRCGDAIRPALPRPLVTDLDRLPTPNFDEYFERVTVLKLSAATDPGRCTLPFEASRGCWWGQKHHCTFCGLNGSSMRYRSKQPDRTLAELDDLSARYGTRSFAAVDNILDPGHLRNLLPRLAERASRYDLFFEIKANLSRDEIQLLADAGVREVQPGIESLSNRVLGLMRKGVTAAQNIDLLRWCRAYGVTPRWNILFGFPDESPDDYAAQAQLVAALRHLQPPGSTGRIWMERFSPLYLDRQTYPANFLAPQAGYGYIYPAATNLARIAYFFDYRLHRTLPDEAFTGLRDAVAQWRTAWNEEPPRLDCRPTPSGARVLDTRSGVAREYELDALQAAVLDVLMQRPTSWTGLHRRLEARVPARRVDDIVAALVDRALVMDDGRWLLGLPIPAPAPDGDDNNGTG